MKTGLKILGIVLTVILGLALLGGAVLFALSQLTPGVSVMRPGRLAFPFIGPLLLIWLVGALMIVAAILFIVWFVPRAEGHALVTETSVTTTPSPPMPHPTVGPTPLELLRVRYAKGEITKEQFDEMKQQLV